MLKLDENLKRSIQNQSELKLSIEIDYQSIRSIDITLHGRVTIVTGKSATGKTLVMEALNESKAVTEIVSKYPILNNIQVILYEGQYEGLADKIKSSTGKIFILDEADKYGVFKNKELCSLIENDFNNTYLIMSRELADNKVSFQPGTTLGTTPANIATLQIKDGKAQLFYKYNIGGM